MPAVGDIYRLPDLLTGFSNDPSKHRWCMVVVADRYSVRVCPRSKSSSEGVWVPATAMDCFTEDGRFYDDWKSVSVADLRSYECAGPLPAAHRDAVVNQYASNIAKKRARRSSRRGGGR